MKTLTKNLFISIVLLVIYIACANASGAQPYRSIDDDIKKFGPPSCMPAEAWPRWVSINIYGRLIMFQWPDKQNAFCHAFHNQQGPYYLMEFIPKNQTLKNWKEMVSISGHYAFEIPNAEFLKIMQADTQNQCSSHLVEVLNDSDDALEVLRACGSHSDKRTTSGKAVGEIEHFILRRNGGNTYIFWFSRRVKPFDASQYQFMNHNKEKWSSFLNNIQILEPE